MLLPAGPPGSFHAIAPVAALTRQAWSKARALSTYALRLALAVIVAVAVLAPLGPLADNRFHHDEATYSSWALDIASGRDIMVSGSPVDKPPLFLYVQALGFILFGATETAARLPSLIASVASVAIVFRLGWQLYGRGTGLLAAFLLAASPFTILFAATAFTDPLMVMFVLAATLAATERRWGWAGIWLGLAAMTKQQGLLFLPLVAGLGYAAPRKACGKGSLVRCAIGLVVMLGIAITWDLARGRQPGFLEQSLLSYNALAPRWEHLWQRLAGFVDLLRYGTGSPLMNWLLALGLPALALADMLCLRAFTRPREPDKQRVWAGACGVPPSSIRADLVIGGFCVLYLVGHAVFAFQVWDRYLLGLMPLLALLLARVLMLPARIGCAPPAVARSDSQVVATSPRRPDYLHRARDLYVAALPVFVALAMFGPLQDAAASRIPVGGDHGAYDGIDQVVNYFRVVPADTTLYHRWLGAHWRFYLWQSPYDFRAWTSPDDLADQAAARPGAHRYVVFPSWRSATEARLALERRGLVLRADYRTLRRDGSVSFVVYRIDEAR